MVKRCDTSIKIRVSDTQKQKIKETANQYGMNMSEFLLTAAEAFHKVHGKLADGQVVAVNYDVWNECVLLISKLMPVISYMQDEFIDLYDTFCRGGYAKTGEALVDLIDDTKAMGESLSKIAATLADVAERTQIKVFDIPFEPSGWQRRYTDMPKELPERWRVNDVKY